LLAKRVGYDGSVTGVDFCEEMLEEARRKANSHFPNLSFQAGDAKELHFEDDTFDIVTVSFGMRNVPDTALALKEARRVLKPGGKFLCLELTRPLNPLVLPFYKFYTFQVMPRIANMIIKTDTPYSYLPRSIDAFFSPQTFKNVIEQCGFSDVRLYSLNLGVATIFRAVKP
jgi:demethylmenaquinone methyltransferase/2-methoxy-6-polyprenyl-1,4-benzoquinol methylase